MYTLEAVYRVETPLFSGGADPVNSVELRAPAFKGALRFWYRALALTLAKTWQDVRQEEQELFGSTGGQAAFKLKVEPREVPEVIPREQKWTGPGSAYLGYGVIGWNKKNKQVETSRPYIKEGLRFTVTLVLPSNKKVNLENLKKALKALGLLGGLGSRSRKGFGSLALESLEENGREIWSAPHDISEFQDRIQELFREISLQDEEPEYSAFSAKSRVSLWPSDSGALELLDAVGKEMMRYRSYGIKRGNRRVLTWEEAAEQNFVADHDLVWSVVQGRYPGSHPRRVVFGLPHNYRLSGQTVNISSKEYQRRASPLFIHIHQLNNGCTAVFTLLPARFLPENDMVKMSVPGGNSFSVEPKVDYQVLHDFINRFDGRLEVLP